MRYEQRDVRFRWVLWGALTFCLIGVLLQGALHLFHRQQVEWQNARAESGFPLAPHPSSKLPREPRLEPLEEQEPRKDHARYSAMNERLHSYGRTDDAGYVHIPVERAIEMLEGKLPVRPQETANDKRNNGLVDSGEPNSGRLLREVPE